MALLRQCLQELRLRRGETDFVHNASRAGTDPIGAAWKGPCVPFSGFYLGRNLGHVEDSAVVYEMKNSETSFPRLVR